jgi:hypothetical protein
MKIDFKNKHVLYTGVCILIVFVIIILSLTYWKAPLTITTNTPNQQDTTTPTTPTTNKVNTPVATLSYTQALKIYADKRLQFSYDKNNICLVTPNYAVYKKGTKIMLDNRHSQQISISVGGVVYNVKGYDFKIITLTTTAPLPYSMAINCGFGKNNATIILQQ